MERVASLGREKVKSKIQRIMQCAAQKETGRYVIKAGPSSEARDSPKNPGGEMADSTTDNADVNVTDESPLSIPPDFFNPMIKHFLKDLTDEQWESLGVGLCDNETKSKLNVLAGDVLHLVSEAISDVLFPAIQTFVTQSVSSSFFKRDLIRPGAPDREVRTPGSGKSNSCSSPTGSLASFANGLDDGEDLISDLLKETFGVPEENFQTCVEGSRHKSPSTALGAEKAGHISPKLTQGLVGDAVQKVNSVCSMANQSPFSGAELPAKHDEDAVSSQRIAQNVLEEVTTTLDRLFQEQAAPCTEEGMKALIGQILISLGESIHKTCTLDNEQPEEKDLALVVAANLKSLASQEEQEKPSGKGSPGLKSAKISLSTISMDTMMNEEFQKTAVQNVGCVLTETFASFPASAAPSHTSLAEDVDFEASEFVSVFLEDMENLSTSLKESNSDSVSLLSWDEGSRLKIWSATVGFYQEVENKVRTLFPLMGKQATEDDNPGFEEASKEVSAVRSPVQPDHHVDQAQLDLFTVMAVDKMLNVCISQTSLKGSFQKDGAQRSQTSHVTDRYVDDFFSELRAIKTAGTTSMPKVSDSQLNTNVISCWGVKSTSESTSHHVEKTGVGKDDGVGRSRKNEASVPISAVAVVLTCSSETFNTEAKQSLSSLFSNLSETLSEDEDALELYSSTTSFDPSTDDTMATLSAVSDMVDAFVKDVKHFVQSLPCSTVKIASDTTCDLSACGPTPGHQEKKLSMVPAAARQTFMNVQEKVRAFFTSSQLVTVAQQREEQQQSDGTVSRKLPPYESKSITLQPDGKCNDDFEMRESASEFSRPLVALVKPRGQAEADRFVKDITTDLSDSNAPSPCHVDAATQRDQPHVHHALDKMMATSQLRLPAINLNVSDPQFKTRAVGAIEEALSKSSQSTASNALKARAGASFILDSFIANVTEMVDLRKASEAASSGGVPGAPPWNAAAAAAVVFAKLQRKVMAFFAQPAEADSEEEEEEEEHEGGTGSGERRLTPEQMDARHCTMEVISQISSVYLSEFPTEDGSLGALSGDEATDSASDSDTAPDGSTPTPRAFLKETLRSIAHRLSVPKANSRAGLRASSVVSAGIGGVGSHAGLPSRGPAPTRSPSRPTEERTSRPQSALPSDAASLPGTAVARRGPVDHSVVRSSFVDMGRPSSSPQSKPFMDSIRQTVRAVVAKLMALGVDHERVDPPDRPPSSVEREALRAASCELTDRIYELLNAQSDPQELLDSCRRSLSDTVLWKMRGGAAGSREVPSELIYLFVEESVRRLLGKVGVVVDPAARDVPAPSVQRGPTYSTLASPTSPSTPNSPASPTYEHCDDTMETVANVMVDDIIDRVSVIPRVRTPLSGSTTPCEEQPERPVHQAVALTTGFRSLPPPAVAVCPSHAPAKVGVAKSPPKPLSEESRPDNTGLVTLLLVRLFSDISAAENAMVSDGGRMAKVLSEQIALRRTDASVMYRGAFGRLTKEFGDEKSLQAAVTSQGAAVDRSLVRAFRDELLCTSGEGAAGFRRVFGETKPSRAARTTGHENQCELISCCWLCRLCSKRKIGCDKRPPGNRASLTLSQVQMPFSDVAAPADEAVLLATTRPSRRKPWFLGRVCGSLSGVGSSL